MIGWDVSTKDAAIGSQIVETGMFYDPDLDLVNIYVKSGNGSVTATDAFSNPNGAWEWTSSANLQPSDAGPIEVEGIDSQGNKHSDIMELTVSVVAGNSPTLVRRIAHGLLQLAMQRR